MFVTCQISMCCLVFGLCVKVCLFFLWLGALFAQNFRCLRSSSPVHCFLPYCEYPARRIYPRTWQPARRYPTAPAGDQITGREFSLWPWLSYRTRTSAIKPPPRTTTTIWWALDFLQLNELGMQVLINEPGMHGHGSKEQIEFLPFVRRCQHGRKRKFLRSWGLWILSTTKNWSWRKRPPYGLELISWDHIGFQTTSSFQRVPFTSN